MPTDSRVLDIVAAALQTAAIYVRIDLFTNFKAPSYYIMAAVAGEKGSYELSWGKGLER